MKALASTDNFLGLPERGKFATEPVRRSFLIMRVMPERLTTKPSPFKVFNRDLKILDAAAFKNAVTSERAWVVTATFAREIRALRFALCKRSPKHVTTKAASVRDSLISGSFAMTLFKKTRELLAGSYLADIISDEEFVLLYDCSFSKNYRMKSTRDLISKKWQIRSVEQSSV